MKIKSIKDAIHGYIKIDEPYWRIIDTIEFQRLKWIEQTSYRVLYPAARHDRFIHSIGVYHLGQKAFEGFYSNIIDKEGYEDISKKHKESFLLACLLHDIGHSPFSHTGEKFYNYKDKMENIDSHLNKKFLEILKNKLNKELYDKFLKDYNKIRKAPSPHEVMSSIIVAMKFEVYNNFFIDLDYDNPPDLDLVIRSILGCTYGISKTDDEQYKKEVGIKNCLIRMLNSSMVDVDKLDYIVRDTAMSGYENISVDNDRLLSSLTFIEDREGVHYPAFRKSALSVIENVVLAKNAQSKWIVSHPVVLYDSFLLECAIGVSLKSIYDEHINEDDGVTFDDFVRSIFDYKSLGKAVNIVANLSLNLLSDIDLLGWMKDNISNNFILEYFSRENRKKPIWKSQAEYEYLLGKDDAIVVADFMQQLLNLSKIKDISKPFLISPSTVATFIKDTESVENKGQIIKILEFLKKYSVENNKLDFEFNILSAKSSFSTKIDAKDVYIMFESNKEGYITYDEITKQSHHKEGEEYSFFYVYANYNIDKKDFLSKLKLLATQETVIYT